MTWYEDDVRAAIAEREKCTYDPETIFTEAQLFTLWKTLYEDFKDFKPVNLGFGGSTLAACVWFFDQVVAPVTNPKRLIVYAGYNDPGDGRRPEEVFIFYHEFIETRPPLFYEVLLAGYVVGVRRSEKSKNNIG